MTKQIDDIIKDLKAQVKGVQGAVIVSLEDSLPYSELMEGFDQDDTIAFTSGMNDFIHNSKESLGWKKVEQMWLQDGDNYVIAARCTREKYLLVKARNIPLGKFLSAIKKTVKELNLALNPAPNDEDIPAPNDEDIPAPEAESNSEPFPEPSFEADDEVIYKHNPLDP